MHVSNWKRKADAHGPLEPVSKSNCTWSPCFQVDVLAKQLKACCSCQKSPQLSNVMNEQGCDLASMLTIPCWKCGSANKAYTDTRISQEHSHQYGPRPFSSSNGCHCHKTHPYKSTLTRISPFLVLKNNCSQLLQSELYCLSCSQVAWCLFVCLQISDEVLL